MCSNDASFPLTQDFPLHQESYEGQFIYTKTLNILIYFNYSLHLYVCKYDV